jgi:hypothetical protein
MKKDGMAYQNLKPKARVGKLKKTANAKTMSKMKNRVKENPFAKKMK